MEVPKNFPKQVSSKSFITPSIPKNYLLGSGAFLLFALAIYFLLAGYLKLARFQIENLDREIQDTVASLSAAEVERVLTLDTQIEGLKLLLPQHVFVSQLFSMLENNTNPVVSFSSFRLDTTQNVMFLEGSAPTLRDVSIQTEALRSQQYIDDVALKDVRLTNENYIFKIEVYFDRDLIILR